MSCVCDQSVLNHVRNCPFPQMSRTVTSKSSPLLPIDNFFGDHDRLCRARGFPWTSCARRIGTRTDSQEKYFATTLLGHHVSTVRTFANKSSATVHSFVLVRWDLSTNIANAASASTPCTAINTPFA